ncbi:glucose-6-phosphate isomerase family protein [Acinetobacter baumannii]
MLHITNITYQGRRIKEDDRYTVTDINTLKNMTVSETVLNAGKATSGHHHDGLEEVYIFTKGQGLMILGEPTENGWNNREYVVSEGSTVCVPAGWFHRVINDSNSELIFTAIFQTYER